MSMSIDGKTEPDYMRHVRDLADDHVALFNALRNVQLMGAVPEGNGRVGLVFSGGIVVTVERVTLCNSWVSDSILARAAKAQIGSSAAIRTLTSLQMTPEAVEVAKPGVDDDLTIMAAIPALNDPPEWEPKTDTIEAGDTEEETELFDMPGQPPEPFPYPLPGLPPERKVFGEDDIPEVPTMEWDRRPAPKPLLEDLEDE